MKELTEVKGIEPNSVYIGKTTVYVRSNIVANDELYTYDEIQYTKDEYTKLLSDQLKTSYDTNAQQIADIQDALIAMAMEG